MRTFSCLAMALVLTSPAMAQQVIGTEDYRVRVSRLVDGLNQPWAVAQLPDGRLLITEKPGALRIVVNGRLLPRPVAGLPAIEARGQGGLLDVVPDPRFVDNQLIYWSYSAGVGGAIGTEVARGRLGCVADQCRVDDVKVIFRQVPKRTGGNHFGSRLVWARDGNLFVTLGERAQQDEAQNPGNHLGTIVRITSTGAIPTDNPLIRIPGARPEIFSYGHRNVQGAALHPLTGELWAHEHGPQGGDEVNIVQAGRNYGWPVITYGRTYGAGLKIGDGKERKDVPSPIKVWIPSIAPCGMAFYTGDRFPRWRNNLFVGSLRDQMLVRLTLDGRRVTGEERIKGLGRVRDVRQGADGSLLVVSETLGAVLKLDPES